MQIHYLLYIVLSIFSFIIFTINFNIVEAQSIENQLDVNATNNQNNITSSIEVIGSNNVSNSAKQYDEFQKFESALPGKVIDMEEFEDENIEKLKEDIERFESSVPPGKVMTFDVKELLDSNRTQIQNITLSNSSQTQYNIKKWEGMNSKTASSAEGSMVPPDITLAVGPDHVVQMVHSTMKIWDKNGNENFTLFLDDFFKSKKPYRLGDPIVLYDHLNEKWFSVIMDYSPKTFANGSKERCHSDCFLRVAVSTDKDPTKPWNIYRIPFGKNFPDFPMVGINNDKFAIGVNIFKNIGGYLGTQAVIIDKKDLLNNDTLSIYRSPFFSNYYTIVPVTSNTKCLYMEANNWDLTTTYVNGIVLYEVCGNPSTNNVSLNKKEIDMQSILLPPKAVQPNYISSETDAAKIRSPIYFNNTIISGVNYSCDQGGYLTSCIGLLKIKVNESLPFVDFLGVSPGDNYHVFYPALSLNKDGNLVMIYGLSSSETYPSLLVMILDQNFNFLYNNLLIKGDGNTNSLSFPDRRTGERFGDYFTAITDPIDKSVWMSGEYGNKNIPEKWSTYIGNIS
jgi:hypothetical protein